MTLATLLNELPIEVLNSATIDIMYLNVSQPKLDHIN
jgi:hypothetical protein